MTLNESGIVLLILAGVVCILMAAARPTREQETGCTYKEDGNFTLQCEHPEMIHVVNATAGVSSNSCRRSQTCCPSLSDDIIPRTPYGLQSLKDKCDRQHKCDANVPELYYDTKRCDYYSVSYICINNIIARSGGNVPVVIQCQRNQHIDIVNVIMQYKNWSNQLQHKCLQNPLECAQFASSKHLLYLKRVCNERRRCEPTVGRKRDKYGIPNFETIEYVCFNTRSAITLHTTTIATTIGSTSENGDSGRRRSQHITQQNVAVMTSLKNSTRRTATTVAAISPPTTANLTAITIGSLPGNGDSGGRRSQHNTQQNFAIIIAGITAASSLLVIHVVLVIIQICWRRRRPAQDNLGTNLTEMAGVDPSAQPGTVHCDISTHLSDDTHVFYNTGHRGATSGGTRAFHNEELVAGGTVRNHQMSPDISLDKLYSKPNKPRIDYEDVHGQGRSGAGGEKSQEDVGVSQRDLEYVEIDHSASHGARSMGDDSRSPNVIYEDVQRHVEDNDT